MKRRTFGQFLSLLPVTVAVPSLASASFPVIQSELASRAELARRALLLLNGYTDANLTLLFSTTRGTEYVRTDAGGPYLVEFFEELDRDAAFSTLDVTTSSGTSHVPVGGSMVEGRSQQRYSVALFPSSTDLSIRLHGDRIAHTLRVYQIA